MPSRRRLGVALVLDPPVRDEVQGLRRALGDPWLQRVSPHLTLIPPVNVRSADLAAGLEVLRSAAAVQAGLLRITLGPPATFLPDNPVLFLEVGGEIERLRQLRDAVFRSPLERPLSWPWVPHVTLADGIEENRIASAVQSLDRYAAVADFDRVVILEETRGRVWKALADARLGPPAVVGTGGLAVRITQGRVPDPLALQAIEADEEAKSSWTQIAEALDSSVPQPIVLTAHRGNEMLGTGALWRSPAGAHAAVFVVPDGRREGTGGHLLAQLESAAAEAGWDDPFVTAIGPAGFYESRSAWIRPATRTQRTRTGRAS
ncbi:MAG TPA: 2'-5' RNA ligase family protein [Acidimicrobiales bacterium]